MSLKHKKIFQELQTTEITTKKLIVFILLGKKCIVILIFSLQVFEKVMSPCRGNLSRKGFVAYLRSTVINI